MSLDANKDSSVNRKLERIGSSSRQPVEPAVHADREVSRFKADADEVLSEIQLAQDDLLQEQDEQLDTIGRNIKQLKYGDLSGKVDALVIINEVITKRMEETADSVLRNSNFLVDSISRVMHDLFNKTPDKIPLKFGKYFISIVNKVCSIKEIMMNVEERKILVLVEQLLLNLLIPDLDKLGERGEGQAIFRNINNTILRILENCSPTTVFVSFLTLLKKYKGYAKLEKLSGIIVKCLLKVTRVLDQLIDNISIERVLLAIHEYLLTKPNSHSSKSDEVGIRITKTIVNELVKLKRESIMDYYHAIESQMTQDSNYWYIKKWIEIILMSISDDNDKRPKAFDDFTHEVDYLRDLNKEDRQALTSLIEETQWGNQFRADQAFKGIIDFLNDYPTFELESYLKSKHSNEIANMILSGIQKAKQKRKMLIGKGHRNTEAFKSPLAGGLKTPSKPTGFNATGENNRLSTVDKMQEYEEKRANLRQKYGSKRNIYEAENKLTSKEGNAGDKDEVNSQSDAQNKLGSSIAAMNSSITEKWRNINTQSNKSGHGLSNTVGGGFRGNYQNENQENQADQEQDKESSLKSKMALQARLNEVKARLGQIKKNHDKR